VTLSCQRHCTKLNKTKNNQKRQKRRQSAVAGRQKLYCAVQLRSYIIYAITILLTADSKLSACGSCCDRMQNASSPTKQTSCPSFNIKQHHQTLMSSSHNSNSTCIKMWHTARQLQQQQKSSGLDECHQANCQRQHVERPAVTCHICTVTRGLQTASQDFPLLSFLPGHHDMTDLLIIVYYYHCFSFFEHFLWTS